MILTEVGEIFTHWESNPPTYLMVQTIASMLGWKPRPAGADRPSVGDIAAAPPPGMAVAPDGEPGMPPAVLDIETLRARNRERVAELGGRSPVG